MILFGGLIMVVLGLTGALSAITDFAGDAIVHAMMAGVGFVLVKTAFGMVKENQLVGWISVASAVIIYLVTKYLDPANALVYTIVGSLIISSVAAKIAGQKLGDNVMSEKMCVLKLKPEPSTCRWCAARCRWPARPSARTSPLLATSPAAWAAAT